MVLAGGGGRAESQGATAAVVGLGAARGAWGGAWPWAGVGIYIFNIIVIHLVIKAIMLPT